MARGQQKIQSQQKNAKRAADEKRKAGSDQKTAAQKALIFTCSVCKVRTGGRLPADRAAQPLEICLLGPD